MKRYIILIQLLFIFLFTCQNAKEDLNSFEINALINNVEDNTIVFIRYDSIIDSTFIRNGKFKFIGNVSNPTRGILYLKEGLISDGFWIENTKIDVNAIKGDKYKTLIQGGYEQEMANTHNNKNISTKIKLDSINNFFVKNAKNLSKSEKDQIFQKLDELNLNIESNSESFIRENPNSYESIFSLNSKKTRWNKEVLEELFLLMNKDTQETYYGNLLSNYLRLNSNPQIGDKYIDFTQKDTEGKEIKLSEVKNKYTLIEFWASWCVPCRRSYPELKKIYYTFNHKGFEIVGVSIDENEDNWLNAIKKDQLPWVNLTDFKVNDNEAVTIYDVDGIPDNVLIDDSDIIIGRDMNIKELDSVLSARFNP